jgi:hypothetical protein
MKNIMSDTTGDSNFKYKELSPTDWFEIYSKIKKERDMYREAILNCLDWSNGRECEWGERAENAFAFLHNAIYKEHENTF